MLKNNINILKLPINELIVSNLIFIFLFKIIPVVKSKIKSKKKFNISIKSKYIFMVSPLLL